MNFWNRHIGDIIRDTVSLTMLEDGAYNRLLDQYYQTERPLPLDKSMIYRLARATNTAERKACDFVIETFFKAEEDGYHQKRCDLEIAAYADKQRKAQASAKARWSKSEGNANASKSHDATDMRTHCEGNAHQTPITNNQTPEDKTLNPLPPADAGGSDSLPAAGLLPEAANTATRKAKPARVTPLSCSDLIADGVTEQTANEFLDLRRKKRAPLTPGAWAGIKAEAQKAGWSVQDAVAKCVTRGWQGFEADWLTPKHGSGHVLDNEAENARAKQMLFGTGDMTIDAEHSAEAFTLPSWVPAEAWTAFVEMRRRISKPMTDYAMGLAVKELEKLKTSGNDPAEVLNQSTMRNYQGLFELRDKNGQPSANRHGSFCEQDYRSGIAPDGSF